MEWSPDGTKLSFVQRDEKGEKGDLWYVDAATGEKKVLVSAEKLASLDPDVNKVKNEREKERLTRYHVAAYLWAPDSKHLIFDSQGQLWLYDLGTETAVQFTSATDPSGDPKFSPDGKHVAYMRKHNLYVHPVSGKDEKQLTKDHGRQSLQRRHRLGVCGRVGRAQQLFLVARQQRDRVPAHGRDQGSDLSHHRLDADASDGGSGKVSEGRRSESGGEAGSGGCGEGQGALDFADQRRGFVCPAIWLGAGRRDLGGGAEPHRRQDGFVFCRCEVGQIANCADGNDARSVD